MKKFIGILALVLIACLACTGLVFAEDAATQPHTFVFDRWEYNDPDGNTKEPTCEDTGYALSICAVCGQPHEDAKYVVTPALGHDPVDGETTYVTTKEPTCTEVGYETATTPVTCSRCDYKFPDKTEEIEIPATGHTWSEEKQEIAGTEKPATCEEPGKVDKAFVCTNKGCKAINEESRETVDKGEALGHDAGKPVEENKVEATCTKTGSVDKVTYCKRCYKELERVTEVIPMADHKPGTPEQKNFVDSTCVSEGGYDLITYCTVCGKELNKEHKVITELKKHGWEYDKDNPENLNPENKATCYRTGKEYGYCPVCGQKNLEKKTNKLDHNYGPEVTVPATCSAPGRKLQECQNEGCTEDIDGHYKIIETYPIDANAHKWVLSYDEQADPESVTRPATCTKHGVNAYVCEYNNMHRYAVQTDPLGHDEFVLPAIEPTCEDPGFAADGIMCKRGEECDGKEVEWPDGYPAEVKEEYKDYKLIKAPTTIPAKEHIKLEIISDTATCTEDGWLTYKCARCGAVVEEESPAKEHDWFQVEEDGEPADCINGGYQSWRCSRCGAEKKVEIPATGEHQFGEPYMIEPTCKTAGREARVCEVCSYEDVLTFLPINPDNHDWQINWENVEKSPTCTEAGLGEEICSYCGQKKFGIIDPFGHDEKYIAEQKPTCTETGLTAYSICGNCGEVVVKPTVIPALGHTPGEPVKENVVEPTETEPGSYDEVIYCTVCEAELSREKKEIPALHTHTPGEPVKENVVEPTVTEPGSHDEVVYCETCGEELERNTIIDEKLKHGLYEEEEGTRLYENGVASTATGLIKFEDEWILLAGGYLKTDFTGLWNAFDRWWTIQEGYLINRDANGIVEFNGSKYAISEGMVWTEWNGIWWDANNEPYLLSNGKWLEGYNGLYPDGENVFLIKNGKRDLEATSYRAGKVTYAVVNGTVDFNTIIEE